MNEVQPPLGSCIAEVDLASGLLFSELISSDHFSIVSLSSSTSYCCVRVLSFQETFPSNNVWIFFHPFAYSQWWYLLSCSDGTWGRQKALLESRSTGKVGIPCFKPWIQPGISVVCSVTIFHGSLVKSWENAYISAGSWRTVMHASFLPPLVWYGCLKTVNF